MAQILPGLQEALEAMNRGDVEPTVALLDPDVDWRARPFGHLWWKHTPSCHGPDEARVNLERQAAKRFRLDVLEEIGDRVLVGGSWRRTDGADEAGEFVQVLTVRDGRIVDIQGFTSLRSARRHARSGG